MVNYHKIVEKEIDEHGFSSTYKRLIIHDYDSTPVSIREFIESDTYIGRYCNADKGEKIWERWKEELSKVFAPESFISTLIITGAI